MEFEKKLLQQVVKTVCELKYKVKEMVCQKYCDPFHRQIERLNAGEEVLYLLIQSTIQSI